MSSFKVVVPLLLLTMQTAFAGQAPTREEQIRDTPITVLKISDGLNVLYGVGGNILVSTGPQGVLTVDSQFAGMVPKYKATIASLGGGAIVYTINTHGHFDHVEGNTILAPDGTRFVGHENARELMSMPRVVNLVTAQNMQPAYPEAARPSITYSREMRMYFNGRQIDLVHVGPAHTAGDTAVILRASGSSPTVVHLGDVFNMAGYPFIDVDNGGDLNGVISFCQAVLAQIGPDAVVIPGHGKVSGYKDLVDYVGMLTALRDRISALIATGATMEQVAAAKPTAPWDDSRGNPTAFVNRAYTSLKR
jgi:glyoxylase-like metal-dependent hydrolase (beta-lactamase superfamily II)